MWRCGRGSCPTCYVGLSLAKNRYACPTAENNKVGVDQSLFRFLLLLLLAFRRDQLLTAQRWKIANESAGLHKTRNIEVRRTAHRRVGLPMTNWPGPTRTESPRWPGR